MLSSNVDFLTNFESLTTLILDHNLLSCDVIFPAIPTLTTLWLNHNLIDKLHPFIQNLCKSFPNLKFLSLMGNTGAPSYLNGGSFYEYLQYRWDIVNKYSQEIEGTCVKIVKYFLFVCSLFVISWMTNLDHLDDRPVTDDQKEEAQRLYSRPFYQTLMNLPFPQYLQHVQQKLKCLVDTFSVGKPDGPRIRQNRIV